MTRLPAAALMTLGLALPAQAFDVATMTAAEREAFRAEVRSYLMDNPEVLMEAIGVLEQRQAEAQSANDVALVQVNADALFRDGQSWVGGNLDGDITLVEFIDYRCGYCRKAHDEVAELVSSDGNIRFVVKEFPILGDQSVLSSRFAIATLQLAGGDAYKRVHDALITFRGNVTEDGLKSLGDSLGLDSAAIMGRMNAPEVDAVIAENQGLAQRLQISGTPTFVVETQMLRGYMPLEGMRRIVDEVRAN
ncbi:DsbA family protein [Rhodovulum euryhalinum]|uniref:Protein-disulfide isomerase n=1 Tax=Rhodovulum euryhalinum TaxID=35805 RepID=A0A4R2KFG9_9RHOB|nr:DsbA family protein [Rhodovulum euryhalinum]TCO70967.1 protein-disulfide isomerase [Rhodovulum euryhalinum]